MSIRDIMKQNQIREERRKYIFEYMIEGRIGVRTQFWSRDLRSAVVLLVEEFFPNQKLKKYLYSSGSTIESLKKAKIIVYLESKKSGHQWEKEIELRVERG